MIMKYKIIPSIFVVSVLASLGNPGALNQSSFLTHCYQVLITAIYHHFLKFGGCHSIIYGKNRLTLIQVNCLLVL